ncbi:hypothetical protein C0J52_02488 [Blattella germanica]|nr:hypothetical protein C0J52_02488 [Blattella germanica]
MKEFDQLKNDGRRGTIDRTEFIEMFKEIATRPEVYFLLIRIANKDYLTVEDLQLFLEGEQGMMDLSPERCIEIINQYEPTTEAREKGQLLIDGFTKYLLSEYCDIFDPVHTQVCQNMKNPLTHYFISSSHNTYLLEDQLKGPSSVEGYVRALSNGCRCVKVDCVDGPDEPLVYHYNTLTSKILFRDCIAVLREYAFVYSHADQQKLVAKILKSSLQDLLYVHQPNNTRDVTEMSPHELRGKILLMGKKLPMDWKEDLGEVTDEDEGAECSKKKDKPKRVPLCKELSDLISLVRCRFIDFVTSKEIRMLLQCTCALQHDYFKIIPNNMIKFFNSWRFCKFFDGVCDNHKRVVDSRHEFHSQNQASYCGSFINQKQIYNVTQLQYNRIESSNETAREMCSMSEGSAAKLVHASAEDFTEYNKMFMTRIYPNGSRVDSSNYNPQEFWNCGCHFVALNFQTPGQMMDFYDAKFKQNGGCGYVLKPSVMREQISLFSANSKEMIPGIPPSFLHLKRKTKTVSNEGDCPIYEESFEFQVMLPELLLIRFVVLDDDYIGDDFIGQYTIPFECLQTGYRHIRLLSSSGEPLDNATLFVHVAITNKKGGGLMRRCKGDKIQNELRMVGNRQVDDVLKLPLLKVVAPNMPAHLHRAIVTFERTIIEFRYMVDNGGRMVERISAFLTRLLQMYEEFPSFSGMKGKKYTRLIDNYTWDVHSTAPTVDNYNSKDRSPSIARNQRKLNLFCKRQSIEAAGASTSRSPTSPVPTDIKPKSILKKSNSNVEQQKPLSPSSGPRSNSWVSEQASKK